MKNILLPFLLLPFFGAFRHSTQPTPQPVGERPTISFTFDDGSTSDMPGYPFKTWNAMLLQNLEREHLKAVFFVTGNNKTDENGRFLLESWNTAGHRIGNHTFSHPNYGSSKMSVEDFQQEFLKTDSIIRQYSQYIRLFRFPYLKEGNTAEKVSRFREVLVAHGYRNGHVTIDASDWAIDSRLVKKLRNNPTADLAPFRQFYLEHLYDRAMYYDSLGLQLTGRHIHHTLLLHHNLAAALFLDDLIALFRAKGWDVVDAAQAFEDPIFQSMPTQVPAGESLLWALAKQSGQYESRLRYPAEDEVYERARMDALGL